MRELTPEQLKYYEENNHKQNIMIALLIVVIVLLGILCVYFTFFNKKSNESNKPMTEKIDSQFEDTSYAYIITDNASHEEVIIRDVFKHTKGIDVIVSNSNDAIDTEESIKNLAQKLGFEQDEIKKMDITLWKKLIDKSNYYTIYNKDDVIETIKEFYDGYKHNLNFDNSVCIDMSTGVVCYDKSIEKFIYNKNVNSIQNRSIMLPKIILNKEKNNDIYKISFIQTYYKFEKDEKEDYCYIVDKDNYRLSVDCINAVDNLATIEKYEKLHEDEMPQYEVTFKINDNSYEFIGIKRLN